MVRLDKGSRWQPPSAFPQFGSIGKIVRDQAVLPGPAQYELQSPLGSDVRGGVMNKGPMRPPSPQAGSLGPGPGRYVTTDCISVQLPGILIASAVC